MSHRFPACLLRAGRSELTMIPAHSLFRLETHSSVQLQLFLVLIGKLPKAHSYLPMDAKVLSLQLVASW